MVLLAYSKCKTANVPISNILPKMLPNCALHFGQYVQLITIDWADQTDAMAKQM